MSDSDNDSEDVVQCTNCDWEGFKSEASTKRILRIKVCPDCGEGIKTLPEIDAIALRRKRRQEEEKTEPESKDGVLDPRPRVEDDDEDWDWNPTMRAGHNGPVLERDADDGYHNKELQRDRAPHG